MSRENALVDQILARLASCVAVQAIRGSRSFRFDPGVYNAKSMLTEASASRRFALRLEGPGQHSGPMGSRRQPMDQTVDFELSVAYEARTAIKDLAALLIEDARALTLHLVDSIGYAQASTGIGAIEVIPGQIVYPDTAQGSVIAPYTITVTYTPEGT